jgi:hypothetical protein
MSRLLADAHAVQEGNKEGRESCCQDHNPDIPEEKTMIVLEFVFAGVTVSDNNRKVLDDVVDDVLYDVLDDVVDDI